jgi:hypothetical protein
MKGWHNIHIKFYQNMLAGSKVTREQSEAHNGLIRGWMGQSHSHYEL